MIARIHVDLSLIRWLNELMLLFLCDLCPTHTMQFLSDHTMQFLSAHTMQFLSAHTMQFLPGRYVI